MPVYWKSSGRCVVGVVRVKLTKNSVRRCVWQEPVNDVLKFNVNGAVDCESRRIV